MARRALQDTETAGGDIERATALRRAQLKAIEVGGKDGEPIESRVILTFD
jgi:hypothetical protein